MGNKKLLCLGNGPVMSFTPYLAKLALVCESLNIDVDFVTWSRQSDSTTAKDPSNIKVKILMNKEGGGSKVLLVLLYFLWMFKVFIYMLRSEEVKVICSRFENSFPVYIASFFKKIDYIYADRDNLHSTYKWPFFLKKIIYFIEYKVARRAQYHLIPGVSRNFTKLSNVTIIPNIPSRDIFEKAKLLHDIRVSKQGKLSSKLVVYITGWITETRGLEQIQAALTSSSLEKNIYFLIAGDVNDDTKLLFGNNVRYLGRISSEESLSYYFDSSIVISLYDPRVEINQNAEPNKWWDCVVTNTPFVTNYNINTASDFQGLTDVSYIDYFSEKSLVLFLQNYVANKGANKVQKSHKMWDELMAELLNKFYRP